MDIFKAIKREKKFLNRLYFKMILLAILLPLSMYLTGIHSTFYYVYLVIVEVLIFLVIVNKINSTRITYYCNNNRLKFKCGIFSKESLIFCDKVVLVHTEKMEYDMEIYIFSTVNFKNKNLKLVGKNMLKRLPNIQKEYNKVKESNEDKIIYCQVVKRGGLKKYLFLDTIYKNCVRATYTPECIENIKISRGQTLV